MNSLNQLIIEGNVCSQPEKKEGKVGTVCIFQIACTRYYKDNEGTEIEEFSFFDIEALGGMADACLKYASKGRGIRIVGRLKQERWEDEHGKSHSKVKIIAEHVEFKPMKKKL